jgi:hypothetical protein
MKLRRPLAVVVATVAALGLFASPAHAETYGPIKSSCSGTKLASWDLVSGSTIFGRTELWYSSANGGQNCVVTYTNSPGAPEVLVVGLTSELRERESVLGLGSRGD